MIMLKTYYLLTKPRIIFGNLLTTVSGFLLASKGHIPASLFLAALVGLSCIIASACVFNNYIDRNADKKMTRTKNRPLAGGRISVQKALLFAIFLGFLGAIVLALYTNVLALSIALTGFFVYVVLYSFWKYHSTYATLVGSISGAIPPVVGYCAVKGSLDAGALFLFMIIVLWQMPHFFAIALYRLEDYMAVSIPVLPAIKGVYVTKIHMLLYIIAFLVVALMPTFFGYTGYIYLIVAGLLGLAWLCLSIKGFKKGNDKLWARHMFVLSLVIITVLCVAISVDVV